MKELKRILLCTLIIIGILSGISYASEVDVGVSCSTKVFGDELWYPTKTFESQLKIHNSHFKAVDLKNITMEIMGISKNGVSLNKDSSEYSDIKNNFNNYMYIQMNHGSNTIYSYDKLSKAVDKVVPLNYKIYYKKPIYLDYKVHMDENAPKTLQGLDVDIEFRFNVEATTKKDDPDDPDDPEPTCEWYHDCIKTLLAKGIINGYPSIKLHPETSMTRAEMAVILANSLKLKPVDRLFSGYVDSLPKWARGHIIAVSDAGVFKGYPGFLFKPNKNITREEAVTVLIRAFNIKADKDIMLQFTDREHISDWSYKYVKTGVQKGILVGYPDNSFKPQANVSRAESFVIVCKLLGYHDEHAKIKD